MSWNLGAARFHGHLRLGGAEGGSARLCDTDQSRHLNTEESKARKRTRYLHLLRNSEQKGVSLRPACKHAILYPCV